ncbi:aspartate carbamoyltransferase regulatory subunit [Patescibacteria group bacterium]|nr:aspartate carbamoyltransferase regulatory subunit [Patescibacteria group bacterium]MBU3999942.1 aspartate carbamoyltransferase regulatory subunit [Patescibacteria group bacterium]MBU4056860.1 aspartate carbamoyltransferase regulatory subunit [Patescibacteria group bacterium]MBU4368405.1 aspartate carbamoyltransferase regulatory subunit [Patescibacteria group bacterium]
MVVKRIENGTVIDHIPGGAAPLVLKILGIRFGTEEKIIVAINVESDQLGVRDVVKIVGRKLREDEVNKIALVAPDATVNIISRFRVTGKKKVAPPQKIIGLMKCLRPTCITNSADGRDVAPVIELVSKNPLLYRCFFCEQPIEQSQIEGCLS